jgi:hypothetical protein
MKALNLLLVLLIAPSWANAQRPFRISELSVDGIYATRAGDPAVYCLLGVNACLVAEVRNAWTDDPLIRTWLANHPGATAVPVSQRNWLVGRNMPPAPRVYIWIEDHHDSVNVALVREGRYPASLMADMVEADRQLGELERDPRLAQFRDQSEKERAETPEENRPHRLVSDAVYAQMMKRVERAELEARKGRKGMWSDAGLKGRSPPRDEYLIRSYRDHKDWFERIRSLSTEDSRLAQVNRDPKTWANARSEGVDQGRINEYAALLSKLDANEDLTGVHGIGQVCLIVADIAYGLFDNGLIKGYVFAPANPVPIVKDLDDDPGESTMTYRPIADNWYLFDVHH